MLACTSSLRKGKRKTYSLGIDLIDVGQSFGKDVAWHLIAKLVSKLRRFALSTHDRSSCIGDRARHDTADRRGEFEDVSDGFGIDEFVLTPQAWFNRGSFFIAKVLSWFVGYLTGTFFCDNTTAQFFPRTPTEVMFAAVMALNAYSDRFPPC